MTTPLSRLKGLPPAGGHAKVKAFPLYPHLPLKPRRSGLLHSYPYSTPCLLPLLLNPCFAGLPATESSAPPTYSRQSNAYLFHAYSPQAAGSNMPLRPGCHAKIGSYHKVPLYLLLVLLQRSQPSRAEVSLLPKSMLYRLLVHPGHDLHPTNIGLPAPQGPAAGSPVEGEVLRQGPTSLSPPPLLPEAPYPQPNKPPLDFLLVLLLGARQKSKSEDIVLLYRSTSCWTRIAL